MARDTDCRSCKKIIKECRNNASRLDTKAGVSLLFVYLTYLFSSCRIVLPIIWPDAYAYGLYYLLICCSASVFMFRASHHSENSYWPSVIAARPHMDVKHE